MQDNLTAKQSDYAVFLPAISSFFSTYVGRQRHEQFVDAARMPGAIPDMEMLNWLNPQQGLFPYRWSLYSAGHADLDVTKFNAKEDMTRNRDPNSIVLGDSGGFQIAKGVWEGDWRNPNDERSMRRRQAVLSWLDTTSNYAMTMDIPTWTPNIPGATAKTGIRNSQDAIEATQFNNEYFIKHRKGLDEGGTKFLNVLQGASHPESDQWYDLMKKYCDPKQYPGRHFNGWGMGGQNMCDVSLVLRRLITIIYDGLLEPGIHDWMHFLGTSKLEWALLLTDIQRAVRKKFNPNFTISFDCASPFLATANGQLYTHTITEHRQKWSYKMSPTVDDKKYSKSTRSFADVVLNDGIHKIFEDSPVSRNLTIGEICWYGPGDLNKLGKEGTTSWDSFSYALMMAHNVWHHIESIQLGNRQYDNGVIPYMLAGQKSKKFDFRPIVNEVFSQNTREHSLECIEHYSRTFDLIIGTRGYTGKRLLSARPTFSRIYEEVEETICDNDDETILDTEKLDQLENSI